MTIPLRCAKTWQLQLDELYAVLREVKDGDLGEDEAIERLEHSPSWVWTAMDPKSKLLVIVDVGCRTLAMAQRVVHQVTRVLAPGCVPLFLTDGLKDYGTALLTHFGSWIQPERRQDKGPRPKPRWMPLPELLYAQVVKSYRCGALWGSNTAWCLALGWRSSRSWQDVAGVSIPPLSKGLTSTSASASRRLDAG
jgi:hypothetical protein